MMKKPLVGDPRVAVSRERHRSETPEKNHENVDGIYADSAGQEPIQEYGKRNKQNGAYEEGGDGPVPAVSEHSQKKDKKNGGRENAPRFVSRHFPVMITRHSGSSGVCSRP